jgi:pyridoxal phosphate enzyme (YggS family)
MSDTITDRVLTLTETIQMAALQADRDPDDITILAATKDRTLEQIDAAAEGGIVAFGENYASSFQQKALDRPALDWHFIGHLQRNKAKRIADHAAMLHTLDRIRLADTLESVLEEKTLDVLIQVNVAGEVTKFGCAPTEVVLLADHVTARCPHLRLRGLMTMPPLEDDPTPHFKHLKNLHAALQDRLGEELPTLSMGMTNDWEKAIECGSTMVRIGTGFFGPRS